MTSAHKALRSSVSSTLHVLSASASGSCTSCARSFQGTWRYRSSALSLTAQLHDRRRLEYKGIILGSPEGDELVGTALGQDAATRKGQAERMKQRAEIMTDRSSDRSFMEYLADRARQQIATRGTGTAQRPAPRVPAKVPVTETKRSDAAKAAAADFFPDSF